VSLLYSKPTFLFQDPQDIVHFGRTILPQRSNTVQSIELAWDGAVTHYFPDTKTPKGSLGEIRSWNEAWEIMAEMKGLKEIRVRLKVHNLGSIIHYLGRPAQSFVQPMKRVNRARIKLILPPSEFRRFENLHEGSTLFELVEETMLERTRF
jgi:hypothetical protein